MVDTSPTTPPTIKPLKSLRPEAPSFSPAPSKAAPVVRPPSVASSKSSSPRTSKTPPAFQQPRGYIPSVVKPTRAEDSELDARIVAARLRAKETEEKYLKAEAERKRYEQEILQEKLAAQKSQEAKDRAQAEMQSYREEARQRKLGAKAEWDTARENPESEVGQAEVVDEDFFEPRPGFNPSDFAHIRNARKRAMAMEEAWEEADNRFQAEEEARMEREHEERRARRLAKQQQSYTTRKPRSYTAQMYGGSKGQDMDYSPGYGSDRLANRAHQELPADEERVTENGSIHRIYPAPAPVGPALNSESDWGENEPSAGMDRLSLSEHGQHGQSIDGTTRDTPGQMSTPPDTPVLTRLTTPAQPSGGSYLPWEGVTYTDPNLNKPQEMSEEERREILASAFKREESRDQSFGREGRRASDNGYAGIRDNGSGERQSRSHDNQEYVGYSGNRDAKPSDGWGDAPAGDSWGAGGGDTGGYGGKASGGDEGCRKCGDTNHWVKECPNGFKCRKCDGFGHMASECMESRKPEGPCRRCGEEGHWSKECPNSGGGGYSGGGSGGGSCFNCGQIGHLSRDCSEPRDPTKFTGTCDDCGERGHRRRDCPKKFGDSDTGYGGRNGDRSENGDDRKWDDQSRGHDARPSGRGGTAQSRDHHNNSSNHGRAADNGWGSSAQSETNHDMQHSNENNKFADPSPRVRGPVMNPARMQLSGMSRELASARPAAPASDYNQNSHSRYQDAESEHYQPRERAEPVRREISRHKTPEPAADDDFGGW